MGVNIINRVVMVTQTCQCVFTKTLEKGSFMEGTERRRERGSRGLPVVDGRSGKHALSWQTLSWS